MFSPDGNAILIDNEEDRATTAAALADSATELTSWVMDRVEKWEDQRDRGYSRLWGEYWRMWRGKWSEEDRSRGSERSRLIAPALSQAIEMTVSEIEEAVFSKEVWFDLTDDLAAEDKPGAADLRDKLRDDMDTVNVKDALSEAILNAAIFGTGIVKVSPLILKDAKPVRNEKTYQLEAKGDDRVFVTVESIRPDEFIPDPSGRTVQEMLGVAHRVKKPLHSVLEKIAAGTYRKEAKGRLQSLQTRKGNEVDAAIEGFVTSDEADIVDVVEYHGKVPLRMLNAFMPAKSAVDDLLMGADDPDSDDTMIEAIITIGNGSTILRAIANPFVMTDRSIIAFQFEKVPGRFWGRGISEKGYNPQKALDAGVRAWIDALGFVSSPMLGVDSGRIPRGFKLEIKPGKVWLTQGPPDEVLRPVQIGQLDQNLFSHASEMERMVQMGTGAFDTASSLKSQSQSGASGVSANSMMMGAFVKRSKRSIHNVDRNLLQPVIKKVMWRYMQFSPMRYPKDYEFQVKATLGIMAREVEAAQMSQLIGMMPEQFSAVALSLVQGVIEHSALPNKAQINAQIAQALAPPPPEQQQRQKELSDLQFEAAKAQAQGILLQNQETIAKIRKLLAEAQAKAAEGNIEAVRIQLDQQELQLQGVEAMIYQQQNQLQQRKLDQGDRALDQRDKQLALEARKPASSK